MKKLFSLAAALLLSLATLSLAQKTSADSQKPAKSQPESVLSGRTNDELADEHDT